MALLLGWRVALRFGCYASRLREFVGSASADGNIGNPKLIRCTINPPAKADPTNCYLVFKIVYGVLFSKLFVSFDGSGIPQHLFGFWV